MTEGDANLQTSWVAALGCFACGQDRLEISHSMQLGPDDYSDDRAIQIIRCSGCGFEGVATYEAERRGSDERFHHLGFRTALTSVVKSAIQECAAPEISGCECPGHQKMRSLLANPGSLSGGKALTFASRRG